jgi:phosphoglycerate dehydrogenase-like enzyme
VPPIIVKPWPGIAWEQAAFAGAAQVVERPCAAEDDLVEAVRDADVLLADIGTPVTARVIAAAPRLRAIMCYASGVDHVDLSAATARGIYVINTAGYGTVAVAEHTVALMLAVARRLRPSHDQAARVSWRAWPPLRGIEIAGKTLGVVGLGAIGRAVAGKAEALGMRILAHRRGASSRSDPVAHSGHPVAHSGHAVSHSGHTAGVEQHPHLEIRTVDLDTLLMQSDVVSLHVALTPDRVHLIGERELRLMRRSAILVNTARGALVDEAALARALREGWIFGAGLDVLETEPPPPGHPLLSLDNVVMTPHNAYNTYEADDRFYAIIDAQVHKVLAGLRPDILVNPEVGAADGGA